jgi:hypothetical protein
MSSQGNKIQGYDEPVFLSLSSIQCFFGKFGQGGSKSRVKY